MQGNQPPKKTVYRNKETICLKDAFWQGSNKVPLQIMELKSMSEVH